MKEQVVELRQMPFFRFLVCYLIGVLMACQLEPIPSVYATLCILCLILLLSYYSTLGVVGFGKLRLYPLLSILFYFFLFLLGWSSLWRPHPAIDKAHFSHYQSEFLIGYVDDEPRLTQSGIRFPFRVSRRVAGNSILPSSGRIMVNVRLDSSRSLVLKYGDELLIPSTHRQISPPYNRHEFDYRAYLENKLIWHQTYIPDSAIYATGAVKGNWLIRSALDLRSGWVAKLERSLGDPVSIAISSALVLGYRSVMDPELVQRFSNTGTIHVLSVSGLHVGIVFAVFSFLLRWMKGKYLGPLKLLLLILFVWLYALLTGFSASVLRAAIMISFSIIAISIYRKGNIINTVSASALFLLLYNPRFINDVGFVLSYLAVLGIFIVHPILNSWIRISNRWIAALVSYASLSIAAQLLTFPFVFYYFHFFPVYFLPANMLIIIPATLVVYLAALVLVLPQGGLLSLISRVLESTISLMNQTLSYFEQLPYATAKGIWISVVDNLLLYFMLLLVYDFLIRRRKRAVFLFMLTCAIWCGSLAVRQIAMQSANEIRFYNLYRNFAIGFFEAGSARIYTDLPGEESRGLQFSVIPDLEASSHSPYRFIQEESLYNEKNLFIRGGLVQFGKRRLFVYSSPREFTERIRVDILYIRNNALENLAHIGESVTYDRIILDGSNSDVYIDGIEREAKKMNKSLYILKNNYAYVW